MRVFRWLTIGLSPLVCLAATAGCGDRPAARDPSRPCFTIHEPAGAAGLRAADAKKMLEELVERLHLSPDDEALRNPRSVQEVKQILRRDLVYFFPAAAAYARSLNTRDGRFDEARLELFLGESQLLASQILNAQEAWVGTDLRIARANLAGEGAEPATDRGRMLAQLIRVVEEGNKIADALGIVAPTHLKRGAEVIRQLKEEAPNEIKTNGLIAEYHRLRGEWTEFDEAIKAAETADRGEANPVLRYLRGMEQLERFRRPDQGAQLMRECLAKYPKFIRAQAALVLMATNPADGLKEIEKLKQMDEDHYLVLLLEPTLAADRELMRMQKPAPAIAGGATK
jgi:hypothetical protein